MAAPAASLTVAFWRPVVNIVKSACSFVMYGKRCMISARAAAECGPAIEVPDALRYRGCGTPFSSCTQVLLIIRLGAVTHDHFATPHWLNSCWPGTRTDPSALSVRPMLGLTPDVVYQRPSSSGR